MERSELEDGDAVRWRGHHGYYTYRGPWDERTAMIYGGSRDPEGQRQYHAARFAELVPDKRRNSHRHLVAEHKSKRRG